MVKLGFCFALFALVAAAVAIPFEQYQYDPEVYEIDAAPPVLYQLRSRRSLQGGAPNVPGQNGGWSVNPNIARDQGGNTRADISVQHKGKNHDFNAGWGKVVDGRNKGRPTWNVGGSHRW
jgi:hypothetical protein